MKTKLCLVLLVALIGQEVSSQRLLGLMASAGLMRALRNREQQQKDSASPLNQHPPEPVAGAYPGSPQAYRPSVSSHGPYPGYSGGLGGNSPLSSLDASSPFGSASYGYPSFSQFGSGSFGAYPGSNAGFAPSAFQGFGPTHGSEQFGSASQSAYQVGPSTYGSAISSSPYASKPFGGGQASSYQ